MLVQLLTQGLAGQKSSDSHSPYRLSALLAPIISLGLVGGCVLCPKQGNLSSPEQGPILLLSFRQSKISARRQTGSLEHRALGPIHVRRMGKNWL